VNRAPEYESVVRPGLSRGDVERVERRTPPDLISRQIDVDPQLAPVHGSDGARRDRHPLAADPVARIDDQVLHGKRMLVDEHVVNVADLSIGSMDVTPAKTAESVQHG
jgi:hypothetical protein